MSNLASMGIYVFNRTALSQRLIEDALLPDSVHDFGHVILPKMVKQNKVFAYRFNDYWEDIGTPEAYHRANLEMVHTGSRLKLDTEWPIHTSDATKSQSKITKYGQSKDSLISPGCVIKGRVENSVLSTGVWVGENAIIRNSVVLANTSIGRNTVVCNAILDEGVVIGQNCHVGTERVFNQPGLTVLGQHMRIASNYDLRPGDEVRNIRESCLDQELPDLIPPRFNPALI